MGIRVLRLPTRVGRVRSEAPGSPGAEQAAHIGGESDDSEVLTTLLGIERYKAVQGQSELVSFVADPFPAFSPTLSAHVTTLSGAQASASSASVYVTAWWLHAAFEERQHQY